MLKVAIVGCGKVADAHASQIHRIKGCEIVGVCDKEPLMARQLYERFPVKRYFSDLTALLSEAQPDVVHISILRGFAWNRDATSMWRSRSHSAPMRRRCLLRAPTNGGSS